MRSTLLAATALVAVASVPIAAATAQDKSGPIRIDLGGTFYGGFSLASQSTGVGPDGVAGTLDDAPGQDRRNTGFLRVSRIHFQGQTNLDNGLQVGVLVKLNAEDCLDQIDTAFVWFQGGYGRVEYGATSGAGDTMFIGSPLPAPHMGLNTPDLLPVNPLNVSLNGNLAAVPVTEVDTDTLDRVNYFTPRIHGIQLGLTYTPVQCVEGNTGTIPCGGSYAGMPAGNLAQGYDFLEGALTWTRDFGPVNVGVYAAYMQARTGDGISPVTGVIGTGAAKQWGSGGQIGYAGFALGGGFRRSMNTESVAGLDATDWNLGLSYTTGPWQAGIQYAGKRATLAGREDSFDGAAVGGSYLLGPGVGLFAAVQYYDWRTVSRWRPPRAPRRTRPGAQPWAPASTSDRLRPRHSGRRPWARWNGCSSWGGRASRRRNGGRGWIWRPAIAWSRISAWPISSIPISPPGCPAPATGS